MFLHYASRDGKMQHAKVSDNELSFVHKTNLQTNGKFNL